MTTSAADRPHASHRNTESAVRFGLPAFVFRQQFAPALLLLLLTATISLAVSGCGSPAPPEPVLLRGKTMGTGYTVKVAGIPQNWSPDRLQQRIDQALEQVNDQMSTWRPDSELSRFNAHEGDDWFPVSVDTARVVAEARRISVATDGAFDATVGPLVNLWHFGPGERSSDVPTDEQNATAHEKTGWQHVEVRTDPPALRKSRPGMYVDLSGIAKGYGVDVVARLLDELGVAGYMVEIGGEVRARGSRPDGQVWRIGIESPGTTGSPIQRIVALRDLSLATSGDYRNFFEAGGKRFSHTIDPRTGRPVDHQLASVTVVTPDCMEADALATALMVLGPDEGYNWTLEADVAAFFIVRTEDGFSERATPPFRKIAGMPEAD